MAATQKTRAVAYIRVSTDKQLERGASLEDQRAKIEAYSMLYDLELLEVYVDAGVSAKSLARPALADAFDALSSRRADALIVVKLDRLTRSVVDLGSIVDRCNRQGWALMSVSEQIDTRTAAGRLVLNVLASVSQWERETIGERTSAAMRAKQSRNEYIGGRVPYGYKVSADGVHLDEDEAEQEVLACARRLRAAGISLRAVARELSARGFQTRKGGEFAAVQVKRMMAA